MNCTQVRAILPEFLRGKSTEEIQATIISHLDDCRECALEAYELRELFAQIDQAGQWSPPAEYWSGLLPRIRVRLDRNMRKEQLAWIPKFTMPIAAVAVLTVMILKMIIPSLPIDDEELASHLNTMSSDELMVVAEHHIGLNYGYLVDEGTVPLPETERNDLLSDLLLDDVQSGHLLYIDVISSIQELSDREIEQLLAMLGKQ